MRSRKSHLPMGISLIPIVIYLLLPSFTGAAERVTFRHLQSLYQDDRGKGLREPEGLFCRDRNLLIVADTGNDRLVEYRLQDGSFRSQQERKTSELARPIGVQLHSKGDLYALDGRKRRIVRLGPEGEFRGYLEPEGIPSPSLFVPRSFRLDAQDRFFILDHFSRRVLILSPEGKYQRQLLCPQGGGFFSDLAVSAQGTIFLLDSLKGTIYFAPKGEKEFALFAGPLKEHLSFAVGLTTDPRGILYVVDKHGGGVVLIAQDGTFLGRQLSFGWNEGLLYYPTQICINENGEAFIADQGNHRVQRFKLTP